MKDLAETYLHLGDPGEWFNQIRAISTKHGFAPSPKDYKANPSAYAGSIREVAQLVRLALTGATRSPDMHSISRALGAEEVLRRIRALGR